MQLAIIFSASPQNECRIRFEDEIRLIQEKLGDQFFSDSFKLIFATSIEDIIKTLYRENASIVHFIGHGDEDTIITEEDTLSKELHFESIKNILHNRPYPTDILFLNCCYSSTKALELLPSCAHIICNKGTAEDRTASKFASDFYYQYFKNNNVKESFEYAKTIHHIVNSSKGLEPILYTSNEQNIQLHAIFVNQQKAIINIGPIVAHLPHNDESLDDVLRALSSRIQVHSLIFNEPRSKVMLNVGKYVGEFSWYDIEHITCKRLYAPRPGADRTHLSSLFSLINIHADMLEYEFRDEECAPHRVEWGLKDLSATLSNVNEFVNIITEVNPASLNIVSANILAQITQYDSYLSRSLDEKARASAELIITSVHGLISEATRFLLTQL